MSENPCKWCKALIPADKVTFRLTIETDGKSIEWVFGSVACLVAFITESDPKQAKLPAPPQPFH